MNTRIANGWSDYSLIAAGDGEKLERWGDYILLRPDPQAIWRAPFDMSRYKGLNARYIRSDRGGGMWTYTGGGELKPFDISYEDMKFSCKLMGFKHTGLFPEQSVNWDIARRLISGAGRPIKVLNLFAYTGAASVACAKAGAHVTHVDAAKAMVERAGVNARMSGVDRANTRYIIDDCAKFVAREIRRGNKYDAIIMDPPSYGRGPSGEVWRVEDNLFSFVLETVKLLSDEPLFMLINSYTTGLQPTVIYDILKLAVARRGEYDAYELALKAEQGDILLPCGCSGLYTGSAALH